MPDVSQIIADIEAWLDKATPGEWRAGDGVFGKNVVLVAGSVDTCSGATVWGEMARVTLRFAQDADGREWYADGTAEANTAYIAACSPDRIRALLDEVKRLRGHLQNAVNAEAKAYGAKAEAEAELARLRKRLENKSRMYRRCVERSDKDVDRATSAEALLREAGEVMRQVSMACDNYGEDLSFGDMKTVHRIQKLVSAFLAKLSPAPEPREDTYPDRVSMETWPYSKPFAPGGSDAGQ